MGMDNGKCGFSKKAVRDEHWDNTIHTESKGFILPQAIQTRPNFREGVTMDHIDVADDVNAEYGYNVQNTKSRQKLPCEKSDAEINRMHEYNQLMGRGTLPKGVK